MGLFFSRLVLDAQMCPLSLFLLLEMKSEKLITLNDLFLFESFVRL